MYLKFNDVTEIVDNHYTLKCPHCNSISSLTAISIPHYQSLIRFKVKNIGIAYKCNSCDNPVFLKFKVISYSIPNTIQISNDYETVENPLETFEFEFLPEPVRNNFKEALACYSIKAYNAFSSMCRRTIQSAATELGVKGNDRVQKQIQEMKEMSDIDEETYNILKQIIVDGHDGAHPHLPTISLNRAAILLELIKDVMYQLFVRKGKLAKAAELRGQQITSSKQ